jgi:hypothetical protein
MAHTWLERGGELVEVGKYLLKYRVQRPRTMLADVMQILEGKKIKRQRSLEFVIAWAATLGLGSQ